MVHEIEADGLPDMTELTGQVAFIAGNVLVSGVPMIRGPKESRWESDLETDFGHHVVSGVTHWVEFPVPIEELTGG